MSGLFQLNEMRLMKEAKKSKHLGMQQALLRTQTCFRAVALSCAFLLLLAAVPADAQEQVDLGRLMLTVPDTVSGLSPFNVMVDTDTPVPPGVTVTVTVTMFYETDDGDSGTMTEETPLTEAISPATVTFTVPVLASGEVEVNAFVARVEVADPDALQVTVISAFNRFADLVAPARRFVNLQFSDPTPDPVNAGSTFTVTLGVAESTDLADATLTLMVRGELPNGSAMPVGMQVMLSELNSEREVSFMVPTSSSGTLEVTVRVVSRGGPFADFLTPRTPQALNVQVRAIRTVQLTLDAPPSVTVGDRFMVEVGVSDTTPIPVAAMATVTVSFGEEQREEVVLTNAASTASVSFMAPASSGTVALELSGSVEVTDALRVTVLSTATQIVVVPIPLMLSLEGPEEEVQVRDVFSVTVGTVRTDNGAVNAVPTGTAIWVTVRAGTMDADPIMIMLTATTPTASVSFTAPAGAGEVSVTATGVPQTSMGSLAVEVSDAPLLPVPVVVQQVDLGRLMLTVPDTVSGLSPFNVMVDTDTPVPPGVTVTVTVTMFYETDDGDSGTMTEETPLTEAISPATVTFTVPVLASGEVEVNAFVARVEVADPDALQVTVISAFNRFADLVAPARRFVNLQFSDPTPDPVNAGSTFTVTLGVAESTDLADATLTLMVRGELPNGSAMPVGMQVMLSELNSEREVSFMVPTSSSGTLEVTVRVVSRGGPFADFLTPRTPQALNVQVRAISTVQLTLGASPSVTVGDRFMVEVGVSDTTPIPVAAMATVTVSFGEEQREEVVLTNAASTASVSFMAPASSGTVALELSGSVEVTDALRVTVLSTATQIVVVPIPLMLSLEGPAEVQVGGEDFSVTVGTTGSNAVPSGTTVTVTVAVDGGQPMTATLTDTISTASVSFTAPAEAGAVSVTATGVPQTSVGSLAVEVSDAPLLTVPVVTVSPLQSTLTLLVLTNPVIAGQPFEVEVGIMPELSPGVEVEVEVTGGAFPEMVTLINATAPMTLELTAPATAGPAVLVAESVRLTGGTALNVEPATATVQVYQDAFFLQLELSSDGFALARDEFEVTVSTNMPVPPDTTVTVTVGFEEDERVVMLTSAVDSAEMTVTFTAPARIATGGPGPNNSPPPLVTATATVERADTDILVMVAPAEAPILIFVRGFLLALSEPAPNPVDAGSSFTVTVGEQFLGDENLADTTVTVTVTFNEVPIQVTLSERTPTRTVTFTAPASTAPASEPLNVTAEVGAAEPMDLVQITFALGFRSHRVRVREVRTVQLTLMDVPPSVTVDDEFTVEVGVSDATQLDGAVVDVRAVLRDMSSNEAGGAGTGMLTRTDTTASVSLTAPTASGDFLLELSGSVQVTDALRVIVLSTAPQIVVVTAPQPILTLSAPSSPVRTNSTFTVTVGISPPLPPGESVEVEVTFGTSSTRVTLTDTMTDTMTVTFKAPATPGTVPLTAIDLGTAGVRSAMTTVQVFLPLLVSVHSSVGLTVPVRDELNLSFETLDPFTRDDDGRLVRLDIPEGVTVTVTVRFGEQEVAQVLHRDHQTLVSLDVRREDLGEMLTLNVTAMVEAANFDPALVRVTVVAMRSDRPVLNAVIIPSKIPLTLIPTPPMDPVDAGQSFDVRVSVQNHGTVLRGTTVTGIVTFNGSTRQVVLRDEPRTSRTSIVSFTAPTLEPTMMGLGPEVLEVTAVPVAVESADIANFENLVEQPFRTIRRSVQVRANLQLMLSVLDPMGRTALDPMTPLDAGDEFTVKVSVVQRLLVGTTVTAMVTFNGSTRQVVLSESVPDPVSMSFTAPTLLPTMQVPLPVTAVPVMIEPAGLVTVSSVTRFVQVRAVSTVQLTLMDVPPSVTVGDEFTVEVGVSDATQLDGAVVDVEAVIRDMSSDEVFTGTGTLTMALTTASVTLTAPASSGNFVLELSGSVEVTDTLRVTVLDASTQISVVPIPLMLSLARPEGDALVVGRPFSVTVGTVRTDNGAVNAVPPGITVVVTVNDSTMDVGAMLTAATPTASVPFMALAAGAVSVTATGVLQTSVGSLEVTVSAATPLTVTGVFPVVLSLEVPAAPVFIGDAFPVTVHADVLPQDSALMVTISLAGGEAIEPQSVPLTADNSSVTVMFVAPAAVEGAVERLTSYTVTTDSEVMGAAVLDVTQAEPAVVFVTGVNANLSGDGTFDVDDMIIAARGLLTVNYAARVEGIVDIDTSSLGSTREAAAAELERRINGFQNTRIADVSGDGRFDLSDVLIITRSLLGQTHESIMDALEGLVDDIVPAAELQSRIEVLQKPPRQAGQ